MSDKPIIADAKLAGRWLKIRRNSTKRWWIGVGLFGSLNILTPIVLLLLNRSWGLWVTNIPITLLLLWVVVAVFGTTVVVFSGPNSIRTERTEALRLLYPDEYAAWVALEEKAYEELAISLSKKNAVKLNKAIVRMASKEYEPNMEV